MSTSDDPLSIDDPHEERFRRLRDAGVIWCPEGDLNDHYKDVVKGLTPHEVDVLIALRKRLEVAAIVHGTPTASLNEQPEFVSCMMF